MFEPYSYHDFLLWNDVTEYLLSVGRWFSIFSVPGARLWARDLVYPLFVAQITWFGMPDVCSVKGEWVEHGIEDCEVHDGSKVLEGFRLWEAPMWHIKLPLSNGGSMLRGEVG